MNPSRTTTGHQRKQDALVRSVRKGRRTTIVVAVCFGVVMAGSIIALDRTTSTSHPLLSFAFGSVFTVSMAVGVWVGARQARRQARLLPDPEALEALRPL